MCGAAWRVVASSSSSRVVVGQQPDSRTWGVRRQRWVTLRGRYMMRVLLLLLLVMMARQACGEVVTQLATMRRVGRTWICRWVVLGGHTHVLQHMCAAVS
jgi:hypothetical protein